MNHEQFITAYLETLRFSGRVQMRLSKKNTIILLLEYIEKYISTWLGIVQDDYVYDIPSSLGYRLKIKVIWIIFNESWLIWKYILKELQWVCCKSVHMTLYSVENIFKLL